MLDLRKCATDSCSLSKNKPLKSWNFQILLAPFIHKSLHQILIFATSQSLMFYPDAQRYNPLMSGRDVPGFKAPAMETSPPSRDSKGLRNLPGNTKGCRRHQRLHPSCLIETWGVQDLEWVWVWVSHLTDRRCPNYCITLPVITKLLALLFKHFNATWKSSLCDGLAASSRHVTATYPVHAGRDSNHF